jgi:hypothetical protein
MLCVDFDANGRVTNCDLGIPNVNDGNGDYRLMTREERRAIVWNGDTLSFYTQPTVFGHNNSSPAFIAAIKYNHYGGFDVDQTVSAIEHFEKQTRHLHTMQNGDINDISAMFKGLEYSKEHNAFKILWETYTIPVRLF